MRGALCLLLPVLDVAQSSLLRVRVIGGDGADYAAGSRSAGVAVKATDELGRPVAAAVVTVRLPDDGPSGSFANGLSSAILTTGPDGTATTSPVHWNALAGLAEIRVTAVSGRLHAGTVATCHLSEALPEKHGPRVTQKPQASAGGGGHLKWILIGAAAAGAAGATVGLRSGSRGGQQSSQSAAVSSIAAEGNPTVGPHP